MEFAYDVFFSYRHRPLDGEITQKTFNAIESYRLPQSIRDQGCQDIRRAFRDTEELPVSRILTDTIDRALHSTNCLVVVCSTDTPSSEWIDREVQTFIEIGRAEHIYPLLISGDPEHSFPPSLKLVPDIMDRVMDIRTPGNHVNKMMAKEETELLRVIAGIVGCKESELLREHKLRKSRRFAARALGWAAAFALVAGVSLYLMNLAQDYRDEARLREQGSMRILSELTYALPDHLTNIPGAYGRIADILEKNTRDINAIVALSTEKERAAFEAGTNYEKLATASTVLGEMDRALEAEDEAIVIFQGLEEQEAPKAGAALASAANNRGNILNAAGRYDEAALVGGESLETNERLTMLRAFALSKKGVLADELFSYPVRGTAQTLLPMTVKPFMLSEDSIWKHLGARPHSQMPLEYFYEILERDSLATPAVADYRLCGYLMDRNLNKFVTMLPTYYEVADSLPLPRHYKEALILYKHQTKDSKIAYTDSLMEEQWNILQQLKSDYKVNTERRYKIFKSFQHTYWYYYLYE